MNNGSHYPASGNRLKTALFWAACLTLPVMVLVVLSIWGGVYLFGPELFLTQDLNTESTSSPGFAMCSPARRMCLDSFAQGMGSNTRDCTATISEPFNSIILLFDEAHLTLAIYVIVALKLACMNTARPVPPSPLHPAAHLGAPRSPVLTPGSCGPRPTCAIPVARRVDRCCRSWHGSRR